MNKVLIITYFFAEGLTIAGLRPLGLAKYLPDFGWKPVIVTAKAPGLKDPGFEVLETQMSDSLNLVKKLLKINSEQTLMAQIAQLKRKLRVKSDTSLLDKLLALIGEVTAYPDFQKGWRRVAAETARTAFQQNDIRAIISISSPVTAHLVASGLKNEFRVPWLADFRDLWTQNHYYPYSRIRRKREEKLELKTLAGADALVTVSGPVAQELGELHKNKPVYAIPNGFDPEILAHVPDCLSKKFTLTYTGNIYPGKQSPEPVFSVLSELISQGEVAPEDIEVRFYGAELNWISELVSRYGLEDVVKQYGIVDRETAIRKQRESQLLILLKWNDEQQKGVYTAKIFEYLAAKRPVLATGDYWDVVDDLLEETRAGVSPGTSERLEETILEYYREYKQTGTVRYYGDDAMINKYSHREMAKKFADILNNITEEISK